MNRNFRSLGLGVVMLAWLAGRGAAQAQAHIATPEQIRDMIAVDSLTPAKKQLRDFVAELRDTLVSVQALHASISRNLASGVTSVVRSDGHQLGRRCHVGGAAADLTVKRVATMYTNDPVGDQALNTYRSGLAELITGLRACQHDDSLVMAAATPDPQRIEAVAAAARQAVDRYDGIRDGLLKLLGIRLPIKRGIGAR